jgi:uncharacterized protein
MRTTILLLLATAVVLSFGCSEEAETTTVTLSNGNTMSDVPVGTPDSVVQEAAISLGIATLEGFETLFEPTESSALEGNAQAQFRLGAMYEAGSTTAQNHTEAMRWYKAAAAQDHSQAKWRIGQLYQLGKGVPQDYVEAIRWYKLSASDGNPNSQLYLGNIYRDGNLAEQDYAEAMHWYMLAAVQGNAEAQSSVGDMYFSGKGVSLNLTKAHMWSNIAAANGSRWAGLARQLAEEKMSPAEIAEAQKLARECMERDYEECDY